MRIRGAEDLTAAELAQELAAGGRVVFYEFCVSLLFLTLRSPSPLWLVRAGKYGLLPGLPYTLVSLLFGWWGIPMGIVYTPMVLFTNLSGGHDVTEEVWPVLQARLAAKAPPPPGEEPTPSPPGS
jgi:hypothetical protein